MNINTISKELTKTKQDVELAVTTAEYDGASYSSGQAAKQALIRSSRLINRIHEIAKSSISAGATARSISHRIHPPIGDYSPELTVAGLLKTKKQDVVLEPTLPTRRAERISEGPLAGQTDPLGREVSEKLLVVGVRSQLSSVDKNFDTLMERAFAETLNLRLRLPKIVIGEVYLIPLVEYDDKPMLNNVVSWKPKFTGISKFIRTFEAITQITEPGETRSIESYQYDSTALIIADFRQSPVRVYGSGAELLTDGLVNESDAELFGKLAPQSFTERILNAYSTSQV